MKKFSKKSIKGIESHYRNVLALRLHRSGKKLNQISEVMAKQGFVSTHQGKRYSVSAIARFIHDAEQAENTKTTDPTMTTETNRSTNLLGLVRTVIDHPSFSPDEKVKMSRVLLSAP